MNQATMTPRQLSDFLAFTLSPKTPILISGAPGIGKTDVVNQAAQAATGRDTLTIYTALSDPVDAKGLCAIVNDSAEFLPYADARAILEASEPLWVFMDEIGQAPPAVQMAYGHWYQARTIGGKPIPDCVSFCAATNRKADRAGVAGILEPVKSRFASIVELETDLESWVQWALANAISIETIAFLRFRPELLHKFDPTTEIRNSASPRTWAKLDAIHQSLETRRTQSPQDSGKVQAIEAAAYAGAVGDGPAAEYLGFLRIWRDLPDVDAVLMNPQGAPVPTDPATLYALTGALAHKVEKDSMDRFCEYGKRIPEEFCVRMVRDAVSMKPQITGTRAYVQWASDMKDLIV